MSGTSAYLDVAKKDFADAARSKMLWVLSALMILFVGVGVYLPKVLPNSGGLNAALGFLLTPMLLLIPILGLIVGYMSIIGERESGSIRALLALPIVRREVLVGKFLGRVGVLAVPVVAGFALASVVVLAVYGQFPGSTYLGFATMALLVAVVYVALAVSVSASVASRGKAMALVVGLLLVLEYLWPPIAMGIYYLLNGEMPNPVNLPDWYLFFIKLTPTTASGLAVESVFDFGDLSLNGIPPQMGAGETPLYLQNWVSWIVLALWVVVPLAIGYYRFQRATIS
jgi:ABC-2 type transport system permease protein